MKTLDFDLVVVASVAAKSVRRTLKQLGIRPSKIMSSIYEVGDTARDIFLKHMAEEIYRRGLDGAVAEAGVYQGDFASAINRNFPDKKLYLFDTFEGFDARDIAIETRYDEKPDRGVQFASTSVGLVLSKMSHAENVIIKKGYVPETFDGIDETFCFVNLDMDLYQPTYAALKWFWPRMVKNGVVLIHDFFDETDTFPNLKKAVIKFAEENDVRMIPIGDNLSIALIK